MTWPTKRDAVIAALKHGETIPEYREGGNSMRPIIASREAVTLRPVLDPTKLKKGDIVLVRVGRSIYTHLISGIRKTGVQISNNHGHVNGWAPFENVYGIVTAISGVERRNSQYERGDS